MILRMFGLTAMLVASCLSVAPAAQRPARSITGLLDTLDRVRGFHETAISPDGRRVAWVEDAPVAGGPTRIRVRDLFAAGERRDYGVTAARDGVPRKENGVAWSPDNHTLAFLSDAASPDQPQLCVADLEHDSPTSTSMAHRRW